MFDVGDTVVQELACDHRATDIAPRVEAVLLKPSEIKDSVMRQPEPFAVRKKLLQLPPFGNGQIEQVDHNNGFESSRAELQEPQLANLWLELERLRVKAYGDGMLHFG